MHIQSGYLYSSYYTLCLETPQSHPICQDLFALEIEACSLVAEAKVAAEPDAENSKFHLKARHTLSPGKQSELGTPKGV